MPITDKPSRGTHGMIGLFAFTVHKPPMSDRQLHRAFFALTIPREVAEALDGWRSPLPLLSGRWVPMANFHMTLAFLGEVDARTLDQLLDSDMGRIPPFSLQLGELGYFAKPKILFVAPLETPPALLDLVNHCQGLQRQARAGRVDSKFVPHVTLARDVEPPVPPAALPLSVSWRCSHVELLISSRQRDGVRYDAVGQWPLYRSLRPQPR